jgi:hypothetical protein
VNVTVVEIHAAGEFGGHIFEYQPSDDLFKCVNPGCGAYEIVARREAREQGLGEITPCPGAAPADVSVSDEDAADRAALIEDRSCR